MDNYWQSIMYTVKWPLIFIRYSASDVVNTSQIHTYHTSNKRKNRYLGHLRMYAVSQQSLKEQS